ncbi:2 TM domain-containing transmembrane protein [Acrasis kona]|uniref:2 TM domain-containing transmembrane protein n=1 Tax=Acrasis kona TaxID=1008807 RepID=A0AAW2YTA6_9EUKA
MINDDERLSDDQDTGDDEELHVMDINRDKFPYSIVWTPIPFVTWMLPFVGHMGIARSDGTIYDFAGPQTVIVDDFSFGRPTKYLRLDPSKIRGSRRWDDYITRMSNQYCKMNYNFFCNNCHNMVAHMLNDMKYDGRENWGVAELCLRLFFFGSHINTWRTIKTYIGFFVFVTFLLVLNFGLLNVK